MVPDILFFRHNALSVECHVFRGRKGDRLNKRDYVGALSLQRLLKKALWQGRREFERRGVPSGVR